MTPLRVGFAGLTHLGQTMARAAELVQIDVIRVGEAKDAPLLASCDLVLITRDVDGPPDLAPLGELINGVMAATWKTTPVVIMSQVPPGFTRPWTNVHPLVFYQVDKLIVNCALDRALKPECHIVGCVDRDDPLPVAYQCYLDAFPAPVLQVGIEAAELIKIAINFTLAAHISAANTIAGVAEEIGADWKEIESGLRHDARIGSRAYIAPGLIGGHLPRDVRRMQELSGSAFAKAIGPLA